MDMRPEELSEEEKKELTSRFFKIQGWLDRLDLPLYEMHGFLKMNRYVLDQLHVEWVEVYNKYRSWFQYLKEMLEVLEEVLKKEEKA
ncbi:MAG: hypothetical protein DRJ67_09875 [Thermoprotei archaeon]|nr:MAG: hypothetical protein DRJ67_09875 [Thermoprotei archaeon]